MSDFILRYFLERNLLVIYLKVRCLRDGNASRSNVFLELKVLKSNLRTIIDAFLR